MLFQADENPVGNGIQVDRFGSFIGNAAPAEKTSTNRPAHPDRLVQVMPTAPDEGSWCDGNPEPAPQRNTLSGTKSSSVSAWHLLKFSPAPTCVAGVSAAMARLVPYRWSRLRRGGGESDPQPRRAASGLPLLSRADRSRH